MKKRDSMNKKLLCVGAICSLVSLFTACELPGPGPGSDGKVVVHVQIGNGVPGRTVMPDDITPLGIDKWELWGGKGDNTDPDLLLTFDIVADAAVALEPGEWHFTIEGYKGDERILSGSIAKQTISLEGTQTLVFEVEPVENVGSGTVSITIKPPADSGITEVKVFKDGVELETSPTTLTVSSGEIVFKDEAFPAGEWYLSFRLYKGDKLLGVVSEMVHVWAGLESAKTYTLLQKDLNLVYTIKYHVPDDTTPVPDGDYQIAATATLAEPSSRPGYTFKGWYANEDFSGGVVTQIPVGSGTGDRDFYSKWIKILSGYSLTDALAVISAGQEADDDYLIILNSDETLGPQPALNVTGGKELVITIDGSGKTISLGSKGSLFTLSAESGSSLTLVLEDITLKGTGGNNAPVVRVKDGGTLDMQDSSLITGNTASSNGGGVVVDSGGALTMSGGAISGNSSPWGGGVYINGGTFTMTGGEVSGNTATYGGGVSINSGGTFTMSGGEVSGNFSSLNGGGVFIYGAGAIFEMSGGEISGNRSPFGGGVYILGGTFTMTGGVVYGSEPANGSKKNTSPEGAALRISGGASTNTTIERYPLALGGIRFKNRVETKALPRVRLT
jgi:uncharacterized repeat protein (TIGR02543 family)